MKKFLSLVLALVMTMSLVTVSAGAKDFTDNDELNYEEAVAVMSELKVLGGYADGSFNPQGNLTRQAAAKIICNLILGPTTASALRADTAPFKDVAVTNDFAGYITYCAQQGIINGYADGTFRPTAPLTGYAFMKMLLGALGYDGSIEGYTGPNWSVQVAKRAIGIGLNAGLVDSFNGVKSVNREEAALYAFNTLKSTMVEYDSRTTVSVGGAEVVIAGSNAQDVVNTARNEGIKEDGKLQFAEKYFTKLSVDTDTEDAFGRPANTWVYNKKEIGTYVDYTTMVSEYTEWVDGGTVYGDIGSVAAKFDLTYYQDGIAMNAANTDNQAKLLKKGNDDQMGNSGNGVLTQVFVDVDKEELTIVEVNTYLAFASADYNTSREYLPVTVYSYNGTTKAINTGATFTTRLDAETFPAVADYEDGQALLVTIADKAVQSIAEPEFMEAAKVTKFSQSSGETTSLTTGGEKYDYSASAQWNDALDLYNNAKLVDTTYDIYFDAYGYVIGADVHASALKYVFVSSIDYFDSNRANATAEASAIFADGTEVADITVDVKKTNDAIIKSDKANNSDSVTDAGIWEQFSAANINVDHDGANWNKWYSYTVKGEKYTLTPVVNQAQQTNVGADAEINSALNRLKEGDFQTGAQKAYGDNNSVYITVDTTTVNSKTVVSSVTSTTTGIKNIDLLVPQTAAGVETKGVYFIWDGNEDVIAAIVVGEDNNLSMSFAYILDGVATSEEWDDEDHYWTFDAIVDGKWTDELTEQGDYSVLTGKTGMFRVWYNKDGNVVKAEDVTGESYTAGAPTAIVRGDTAIVELLYLSNNTVKEAHNDTLYTNAFSDNGIVMADDCAYVVRYNDGDEVIDDSVGSLKSALTLADKDRDSSNGYTFTGSIVAVLNDKGQAVNLILDCTVDAEPGEGDGSVVIAGAPVVTFGASPYTEVTLTTGVAARTADNSAGVDVTNAVITFEISSWDTVAKKWNTPEVVSTAAVDVLKDNYITGAAPFMANAGTTYKVTVTVSCDQATKTFDSFRIDI